MWRYSLQPAGPVRDAVAALRAEPGARPRARRRHRAESPRQRAHHPHRVRIQAAAGRLRHSHGATPRSPPTPTKPCASPARSAIPVVLKLYSETITHKTDVGGVQLNLKDADAVRAAFDEIEPPVAREGGRRALPGRHRAADDQARRLRADHRQQHRRAVRPGAAVRRRRATGRGLQGPRPGPAAAQLPPWPGA